MPHELAGKTVRLKESPQWNEGAEFTVENTAWAVLGKQQGGMMETLQRIAGEHGDVLYGKIGGLGYVASTSQIIPDSMTI